MIWLHFWETLEENPIQKSYRKLQKEGGNENEKKSEKL